jgi:tetratricopeptide (TPR) repeat protein
MKDIHSLHTSSFLQKFTLHIHKYFLLQSGLALLGIILFLFSCTFLVGGKDGFAASALALAFVCFFVLYSLSFTMQELVLIKSLECKKEIEPLYDLSKKEALFECVEEYSLLASTSRKLAFHYESDSDKSSYHSFFQRIKRFFFWKEFHLLEEICLLGAIDLLTRQVRTSPCDVDLHARLANTFILLQNHFLEPIKAKELMKAPSLFLTKAQTELLKEKATRASRLAVEELEIMSSYAPDEIWVHEQLAISYREIGMQQKEISECERLLVLSPDDPQVLLRLGSLYFQTGQNGKGLKLYNVLKEIDSHLGQELISCYGSSTPFLQTDPSHTK